LVTQDPLADALEEAAHLLPAQGPISVFIHHNTLHAFEDEPFSEAVVRAGEVFGARPFLLEARYREELGAGRILPEDVRAVVADVLGARAEESILGLLTRGALYDVVCLHGYDEVAEPELHWRLAETDALRSPLAGAAPSSPRGSAGLAALWDASRAAITRAAPLPPRSVRRSTRLRDPLLAATDRDPDTLVHPLLIRLCAAFLDQGVAYWPMPERDRGFFAAFLTLYGHPRGGPPDAWLRGLPGLAAQEIALGPPTPKASIRRSLDDLGVAESDLPTFVSETALALAGWAGMMHQVETRPDRVPVWAPPASLADFLAVRLLLERLAIGWVARDALGYQGPLAGLRPLLGEARAPCTATALERAYRLFQASQLLGFDADRLHGLDTAAVTALEAELEALGGMERRRLLHLAFERHAHRAVLSAVSRHAPAEPQWKPSFQVVTCLDEREESLRRHLEEVAPDCETLGAAGFFAVPMYYLGITAAHARPSCPVVIRPEHEVREEPEGVMGELTRLQRLTRQMLGRIAHTTAVQSRTFVGGTLVAAMLGTLHAIPLVLRVLFPGLAARLQRGVQFLVAPPALTRLQVERRADRSPSLGRFSGFDLGEQVAIVRRLLGDLGLARPGSSALARLVLLVGHGSSSLNNPHESAYDCGACGGGHGGPNGRAYALMANHPQVRDRLRAEGIPIPEDTWFVGGEHNSCSDTLVLFDRDLVPATHQPVLAQASRALHRALARNAQERSRRFMSAPLWLTAPLAHAHVVGRSEDLAQARPECGHATNLACIVGRRTRTRGLFLDRRSFLVSYDPTQDDATGSVLAGVLAAVVPVVAGINLEYYFSYVDPVRYGSGTKLPHNITGLIGVMDGQRSDLRTGLPWQMVEIHEPVRLLMLIETNPLTLLDVLEKNRDLWRLARGGWVVFAALEPGSSRAFELRGEELRPFLPGEEAPLGRVATSQQAYRGRRGHLQPVEIAP
jgi:uncharacterized protein YbcC (UPF0753/DUF2309 family)